MRQLDDCVLLAWAPIGVAVIQLSASTEQCSPAQSKSLLQESTLRGPILVVFDRQAKPALLTVALELPSIPILKGGLNMALGSLGKAISQLLTDVSRQYQSSTGFALHLFPCKRVRPEASLPGQT
jgi:hypothetical protein